MRRREKIKIMNQPADSEKNFNFDQKSIFYPRGIESGVLLLHSFTSTPYEFSDLARYLAEKDITVYVPTLAGHGTNPDELAKTTALDWQKSAEHSYLFLKQHVKKIYVIGSSFGGNLALYLATKFTNPLAGIVSMGTPIKVRWQKAFKFALYSYGWLKKYQKKRRADYKLMYLDQEQVVYPVMPVPSLRRFFNFIKKITIPSLSKIKVPILIIQSSADRIVSPDSAQYLHEHLGSEDKRILWINGSHHALAVDDKRGLIYRAIYRFITDSR
ncbi:MAG: hypothetical protein A2729_05230 [Candidatus Buchananbacteria bacterium RIFCSPHIGHO2_01_FULL_39_14]|uniref:Serine aminopeptidase S33 domain-containing protein n=2 Tax=Candidatus Buchananiibacteriota TaxID=1817903 RepID=A0A1G1YRM5_9BACT|nr:MAG: hypothetical protein A2729_05230 [Candidatus Buchananbacteria bacterium RIFCSPHIGHO2_01_FULL_39_14]OGY48114.1 MAG: hypothetical protein A3D39_03605 [Candidatus Buchananbacteria bacterium RIFCSPHIGHO2_02_FULL_39_17]OGY54466.1 MAG: hypothetical protein A2912_05740 [Candidatus Buchananbacteria bacterium RIFCSPLOWO2_01_FULL_40_23b]